MATVLPHPGPPPEGTDDADNLARIAGVPYVDFLETLHKHLKPKRYLEIGTEQGVTLALSSSRSVSVDPSFRLNRDIMGAKPACMLFAMGSDQFFAEHDVTSLLGGPVDLAFLDGMHLFEFLLRDFINTEKHCRPNSIILLHDCVPPGFYMTVRALRDPLREKSRFPKWWTGDVWKVLPVLQKYRPDLAITVFDCPPTGLIAITNLDPSSTVLPDAYPSIIAESSKRLIDRGEYDAFWNTLTLEDSTQYSTLEHLTTRFWL